MPTQNNRQSYNPVHFNLYIFGFVICAVHQILVGRTTHSGLLQPTLVAEILSFTLQSALRQVLSLSRSEFSTERDLVLSL